MICFRFLWVLFALVALVRDEWDAHLGSADAGWRENVIASVDGRAGKRGKAGRASRELRRFALFGVWPLPSDPKVRTALAGKSSRGGVRPSESSREGANQTQKKFRAFTRTEAGRQKPTVAGRARVITLTLFLSGFS